MCLPLRFSSTELSSTESMSMETAFLITWSVPHDRQVCWAELVCRFVFSVVVNRSLILFLSMLLSLPLSAFLPLDVSISFHVAICASLFPFLFVFCLSLCLSPSLSLSSFSFSIFPLHLSRARLHISLALPLSPYLSLSACALFPANILSFRCPPASLFTCLIF